MIVQTWTEVIVGSLQNMWYGLMAFIPNLLGALVILVVGLIVASGLGMLVQKVFEAAKLDSFLHKLGLAPYFERAGIALKGAHFLGRLVYWFLAIAFVLAAADVLRLTVVSQFLRDVLLYVPNVIVAVLIMLATVVAADFIKSAVTASVMSARLQGAKFLGGLSWWAVSVFGFLAALAQLNVAEMIVNSLVTGFVVMLALAGGLAFGLGGKEYAAHLLSKLRDYTE